MPWKNELTLSLALKFQTSEGLHITDPWAAVQKKQNCSDMLMKIFRVPVKTFLHAFTTFAECTGTDCK
jgi:hypothetical protein